MAVHNLENDVAIAQRQLKEADDRYQAREEHMQKQEAAFNDAIRECRASKESLEERLENSNRVINDLNTQLKNVEREREQFKAQADRLSGRLEEAEEAIEKVRRQCETTIARATEERKVAFETADAQGHKLIPAVFSISAFERENLFPLQCVCLLCNL